MLAFRLAVAAFVSATSLLFFSSPASAKSFTIPEFDVQATLNADASMDVVERITYDFDGHFQNGTRPIPPGDYDIVNMTVTENGQPLHFDGAPYNLAWHFSATGEHTYEISYRVLRAAKVGPDVGELYWKWMGADHGAIGDFAATLKVPTATDVRAWGHGPPSGNVAINGDLIHYQVSPLPASTFLEARVTAPSAAFTVAPSGDSRLPGVLAQEQRNADIANAQRDAQSQDEENEQRLALLLNIFVPILSIGAALAFYLIWKRWGNDPDRSEDIGQYVIEPPDVSPATVVATLRSGDAFAGTLVDLAQRGYLRIEEYENDQGIVHKIFGASRDWRLTRTEDIDDSLLPFEVRLLDYLFQEGPETTQSELHDRAQDHQAEARNFFSSFDAEAKQTVDDVYWKTNTLGPMILNIFMSVALFVAGVFAVASGALLGVVAIVVSIVLCILTFTLSCRTELGARKAAEWGAFRNYMRDFGNFKDAPVGHLILWERYLVYATALGVASQLANGLAVRVPDDANNANFATWYVATSGVNDIGRIAGLSTFSNGVTEAFSPPSQSSSGSGGGGGFSGGGGGGGGGGGVGAS